MESIGHNEALEIHWYEMPRGKVDTNLPHWFDADFEHKVLRADRQVGQAREVRVNGPEALDL